MINTIQKAIKYYGIDTQQVVCMEECGELIQAISKMIRYKSNELDLLNLIEEMADVLVCIEMLKEIHYISNEELEEIKEEKIKRIEKRMERGE